MNYIETICVIDDPEQLLEAYLKDNGQIEIHLEDGENGVNCSYDLDAIKHICAALGHLVWLAENQS